MNIETDEIFIFESEFRKGQPTKKVRTRFSRATLTIQPHPRGPAAAAA